ncbi:Uncharacterized protein FWK35_00006114 [Aphis craccivora]|uniref:DUF4806 domain-containing protein n=1 Tax=Aphis craccivora TaxID=307492 RepID=A0A6G0YPS4_APHCR|nr:Uncharacterized protein FWK35_00006114 [Aphis craccivora]
MNSRSKRRGVQEEAEEFIETSNNITSILPNFIEPPTLKTIENIDSNQQLTNQHITNDVEDNEFIPHLIHSLSSSSSSSSEDDPGDDDELTNWNAVFDQISLFRSLISEWAVSYNILQNALNKLLKIHKQHKCFETLPKDSRTVLNTNQISISNYRTVKPGKYYHFGILNGVKQNMISHLGENKIVQLVVAYIRPNSNKVLPIGIYCGKKKLIDSNDFLKEFVEEAKELNKNGICINNTLYTFSINAFSCDAPAKSFILKIKGHSGFYSCSRLCLGTVLKLILLWIKGPVGIRYPTWKIKEISNFIQNIKKNMPCEFARKQRKLEDVNRWKATEFQVFLLYIGTIVTKTSLKDLHWNHFFKLNISMIILLSPDYSKFIDIARRLLDKFVKDFEVIYGRHFISHNIHGLMHLCDDYNEFGPLDHCSAFPFENYMGCLNKMLRKPHKPLEQIIRRYSEVYSLKTQVVNKKYPFLTGLHKRGPTLLNTGKQFTSIFYIVYNFKIWAVVEFNDDRSVEAVPSFWIKNKRCAWPKKNSKQMIERRRQPNEIEFDFLKAGVLGNKISNYISAIAKAKKAEYTSDLSTNDSSSQVESNMRSRKGKKILPKQKQTSVTCVMWSPTALDKSGSENVESDNSETNNYDSDKDPNYNPSAFIVDRIISKRINESYLDLVHTSSSPFKVSIVEASDVQPSLINSSADINHSLLTTSSNSQLELLQKINRTTTTCTLKYDLQYLNDKVSNLENILLKQDGCIDRQFMDKIDKFQNEFLNLPLETEEELDAFEKNLLNNDFRTKMISELIRFSRNSLPSTIRSIMRYIFKDSLLEKYSYKGFKKKKVFYTLSICSVIFEAIKHMKKFNKFDTIDVETPLRTFISGAKFRDTSNKIQLQNTHISSA